MFGFNERYSDPLSVGLPLPVETCILLLLCMPAFEFYFCFSLLVFSSDVKHWTQLVL